MKNENKFIGIISSVALVADVVAIVTIAVASPKLKAATEIETQVPTTAVVYDNPTQEVDTTLFEWVYNDSVSDDYQSPIQFSIDGNAYNLGCSIEDITSKSAWYVQTSEAYGGDENATTTLNGRSVTLLSEDYPTCLIELLTLNDKVCAVTYVANDSAIEADVTMNGIPMSCSLSNLPYMKKTTNVEYKYTTDGYPYSTTHYCEYSVEIQGTPIAIMSGYVSDGVDNMVIIDPNLYPAEYISWVLDSYKEALSEASESEVITEFTTEQYDYEFELPSTVSAETFETIVGEADFMETESSLIETEELSE